MPNPVRLLTHAAAAAPAIEARTYAPDIEWDPEVQQYLAAALGPDKLRQISLALARPPLATCLRVNTLRTTPEVCSPVRQLRVGATQPSRLHSCLRADTLLP